MEDALHLRKGIFKNSKLAYENIWPKTVVTITFMGEISNYMAVSIMILTKPIKTMTFDPKDFTAACDPNFVPNFDLCIIIFFNL